MILKTRDAAWVHCKVERGIAFVLSHRTFIIRSLSRTCITEISELDTTRIWQCHPGSHNRKAQTVMVCFCFHSAVFALVCLSLQCLKIITRPPYRDSLAALTAPQPDGLTVLLQIGNELVTLLDNVCVLLVLVVRSVGLDDALDAVDGAGYAVGGDESSEVPVCC